MLVNSDPYDVGNWRAFANKENLDEVEARVSLAEIDIASLQEHVLLNTVKTESRTVLELRNNSLLIPGQKYRITDYECTTTQADTHSAGHQFDIIVEALDVNVLSEDAQAIQHDFGHFMKSELVSSLAAGNFMKRCPDFDNTMEVNPEFEEYYYAWGTDADIDDGDSMNFVYSKNESVLVGETVFNAAQYELTTVTKLATDSYFGDSKLEAWEIKYCIYNDTSRFAWADTENGKGVIYYMKDENGNECPYDFKNIQFNYT